MYATDIKRAHLYSLSITSFLFLLIFAGVMLHFYSKEFSLNTQNLTEAIVEDEKVHLRKGVDRLIAELESDLHYCKEKNRIYLKQGILGSNWRCDGSYTAEMMRNRFASHSIFKDEVYRMRGIIEYNGSDLLTGNVDNFTLGSIPSVPAHLVDILNEAKVQDVLHRGEIFFKGDALQYKRTKDNRSVLYYARYYKPLSWIFLAELRMDKLSEKVLLDVKKNRQNLIKQSMKIAVPVILFLVLVYCVGSIFYYRTVGAVDGQRRQLEKKDFEIDTLRAELRENNQELSQDEGATDLVSQLFKTTGGIVLLLVEPDGERMLIRRANRGIQQLLGYDQEELNGLLLDSLCLQEKENGVKQLCREVVFFEENIVDEFQLRKKDGSVFRLKATLLPTYNASGKVNGIIFAGVDSSNLTEVEEELKLIKEQLESTSMSEDLAGLSGGVAQDFNNIITSIYGFLDLLKDQLPADSVARGDVEQILVATAQASKLIRQILSISRIENGGSSFFDPAPVVTETINELKGNLSEEVEIGINIESKGRTIFVSRSRFKSMLMALCQIGINGMRNKLGSLHISLMLQDGDLPKLPDHAGGESKSYFMLSISYDGELLSHQRNGDLFEPSATTGQRTDDEMELWDAGNMVKMAGGHIWYDESETGKTCFHVVFPMSMDSREKQIVKPPIHNDLMASESILLVDDEPDKLVLVKKMLEGFGYGVHTRLNGYDALHLLRRKLDTYDLIIADQSMPGMDGAELSANIRQISSSIPIVLITGYSSRISEQKWKSYGIDAFIMKPFSEGDIGHLLRDVLQQKIQRKDSLPVGTA